MLQNLNDKTLKELPFVVCSLGDASVTEGEIAEAFQMAALKQLPILYLVQDNEWDISAHASETRAVDATHYAKGFGLKTYTIDGTDFTKCYETIQNAFKEIRNTRSPILIHAKVPLLNHHTSGVRMEWYRDDLEKALEQDPFPKIKKLLLSQNFDESELISIERKIKDEILKEFKRALAADDPKADDLFDHKFAPTENLKETELVNKGNGEPIFIGNYCFIATNFIWRESNLRERYWAFHTRFSDCFVVFGK